MIDLDETALRGSIPPLVTPFANGEVDYDAYAGLVAYQAENGTHGVLVNGTTSEPSSLTVEERNRLVDVAVEAAAGRVTVVVATGSQSYAETEALTLHAVGHKGVDALLIVTPYYARPPQRGMVEYYKKLAGLHDKPWMIYHIPGRAAVDVKLETVREIAEASPTFVGMKHASLDLGFVSDLLQEHGDGFRIFVGLEELSFPDDGGGGVRPHECRRQLETQAPGRHVRGGLARRSLRRPGPAPPVVRDQQGGVLRHQSDPDEIHDEAAWHSARERAPAAAGARDRGA